MSDLCRTQDIPIVLGYPIPKELEAAILSEDYHELHKFFDLPGPVTGLGRANTQTRQVDHLIFPYPTGAIEFNRRSAGIWAIVKLDMTGEPIT